MDSKTQASEIGTEAAKTQRAFANLRLATVIVTLALVAFTLWISDGVGLGRGIAAGVLTLGFIQWLALRRIAHQIAAASRDAVETDGEPS
ncbi:MAG: hypothetical protein AAFP97_10500 [Pseudomonadota bacterium]